MTILSKQFDLTAASIVYEIIGRPSKSQYFFFNLFDPPLAGIIARLCISAFFKNKFDDYRQNFTQSLQDNSYHNKNTRKHFFDLIVLLAKLN